MLMSFFQNEQRAAIGKFKIVSCFETAVDAIESGLVKDNEDVELNCLVFSMTRCSLTCGINKKQW
eukprot:14271738-Ditylum_brightwellii.AAC.1